MIKEIFMQGNSAHHRRMFLGLAMGLAYMLMLSACGGRQAAITRTVEGGDAQRGGVAMRQYGCGACHVIPGVEQANKLVGPPLIGWADRIYIAGRVPNTPENLIVWIQNPQEIDPQNAMPNLGVSESEARDMAAYLYTLRGLE